MGVAALADSDLQRTVVAARIEGGYAAIQKEDGSRGLIPLTALSETDRAWLQEVAQRSPLAKGKSTVQIVRAEEPIRPKITIETARTENGIETVQLCPPNLMRDQIGGTCMLYARVHWLDIAGYYLNSPEIYKIINQCPRDKPWLNPQYYRGLDALVQNPRPRPLVHQPPPGQDLFGWARAQLRLGRPLLAAFPREIWQALPPSFVGRRPWSGGKAGHQIVINGFTFHPGTGAGSFRIINSWAELPQFDLDLKAAGGGALDIEASLSPKGEAMLVVDVARETVRRVTFLRPAGKVNLYEVETDRGTHRVAARDEAAARAMVEQGK